MIASVCRAIYLGDFEGVANVPAYQGSRKTLGHNPYGPDERHHIQLQISYNIDIDIILKKHVIFIMNVLMNKCVFFNSIKFNNFNTNYTFFFIRNLAKALVLKVS